jgi:aromatic-L-amino-acid/L-tryptophan decarboxylase
MAGVEGVMNADSEVSPAALDGGDPAELGQLTATVERVLPAIEKFWRFDGRDDAGRRRPGWLARLDVPLPEAGGGIGAVVADLAEVVIPNGARVGEPGWSSFITTGPTTSAVAAWLAAAAAGSQRYAVQAFNTLERVALDWVAQLCGIPAAWQGVFSSGGSTANLVALGAARQQAFERRGLDVSADGLPPAARARVYASEQAHNTIQRATAVLGLGRAGTRRIACDARQRIDLAALRAAIAADERDGVVPVAVVGTAGTTDTGAIDPLGDLAEVAREHGAWFHVDGAYGLIAAASPALRPAFAAVADADSVIVDPHKWLATGAGCAATYVRDAGLLTRAFAQGPATYMEGSFSSGEEDAVVQFDSAGIPYWDMGVELSAPSRGVLAWAVLRELGRAGIAARVERHIALARHLAQQARQHPRLDLLLEPELSIVCFRYAASDAVNAEILLRLRRTTRSIPSSTVVGGHLAIRPCFINPRTRLADVDALVDHVTAIGDELTGVQPG